MLWKSATIIYPFIINHLYFKCVYIFHSDLVNFIVFISIYKWFSRVVTVIIIISFIKCYNISIYVSFHNRISCDCWRSVLWIDSYDVTTASYTRHQSQYLVDSSYATVLETHHACRSLVQLAVSYKHIEILKWYIWT